MTRRQNASLPAGHQPPAASELHSITAARDRRWLVPLTIAAGPLTLADGMASVVLYGLSSMCTDDGARSDCAEFVAQALAPAAGVVLGLVSLGLAWRTRQRTRMVWGGVAAGLLVGPLSLHIAAGLLAG